MRGQRKSRRLQQLNDYASDETVKDAYIEYVETGLHAGIGGLGESYIDFAGGYHAAESARNHREVEK